MDNLKSCPFCGGEAEIQQHIIPGLLTKKDVFYSVWCQKCGGTNEIRPKKEQAIKAWNTRALNELDEGEITRIILSLQLYNLPKITDVQDIARAIVAKFAKTSVKGNTSDN